MVGCFGESRVGITAAVHLAQAVRNIEYYDLDSVLLLAEQHVSGGAGARGQVWRFFPLLVAEDLLRGRVRAGLSRGCGLPTQS